MIDFPTITVVVAAAICLGIYLYMDWRRRRHLSWMEEFARTYDRNHGKTPD